VHDRLSDRTKEKGTAMTSRERILAAIRNQTVDRVPTMPLVKQFCTRQLGKNYAEYNRDHRVLVECQLKIHDRFPFDCFNVLGFPYREAGDCGLPLAWPPDALPRADGVLVQSRGDIKNIRWPDPPAGPLMRDRLQAIELFKKNRPDVAVLGWVEGCFAQAMTFRGLDQGLMDLALEPELVRELMAFILPHEIAFARAQVKAGADIIGIGDAAASLVSRRQYIEFILPYEKSLIQAVREMNVPVKLHICGNITHLLSDIAALNADMIDIDWMVDLREARKILGPKVCLCGNFDPVRALLQSTPGEIRAACLACIREAGPPFVLAPGCEVPPDTSVENFAVICDHYAFE
jgi:uroporphyrinogen-III decarboxylase